MDAKVLKENRKVGLTKLDISEELGDSDLKYPEKLSTKRPKKSEDIIASSGPDIHPDATLDPMTHDEETLPSWQSPKSTNAPEVGEPEDEESHFASGIVELIDKFLHGRVPIKTRTVLFLVAVGWFAFISWLFLQDNQVGKLDTIEGMKWFWCKSGIYSLFVFIVGLIIAALERLMPAD